MCISVGADTTLTRVAKKQDCVNRRTGPIGVAIKKLLLSRNVTVNGRRTSLRLEQVSWEAIDEICVSEGVSLHELGSMIEEQRGGSSRTSTVRAFIVTYFRQATANQGKPLTGTASSILPEMATRY